jgi:hypothetical protein
MKFKLLFIVCCMTASLAVSRFALAQDDSTKPAAASNAATDPGASASPDSDVHPNLPPGTKSVMKRPADSTVNVRAGYDGPAMVPVRPNRINDPAVQQAGGASADTTTGAAATGTAATGAANATKAPADTGDPAQAAAAAASELINQGLTAPKESPLAGRPTTLLELIARVGTDRNRQIGIVRAYWKLSVAQADYNWAADELARLDQIVAAKGLALESAVLSVAQAGAQARVHEAQVVAVSAQQELADLLAWPSTTPLPLAGDQPLVGPYRTYFDTLFAGRVPPARTRVIDRSLPIRLEAIQDRTLAVQAASSAVRYAEDARGKGQTDLQALLNCHAELARQRRAFLSTVRDYNFDIGEYALAVADPALPNERLVAMLIVVKPAAAAASARNEPTLAPAVTDDQLLQPALPAKSADAGKQSVRRASGAEDGAGK